MYELKFIFKTHNLGASGAPQINLIFILLNLVKFWLLKAFRNKLASLRNYNFIFIIPASPAYREFCQGVAK